ncbi:MAG: acyltransferase [Hyphomonadaceae bacterium]|nr:acyltransferase [Hyphomonadaceae bacterium]
MQDGRIDEIDGLRAAAMTGVVAQHCGLAPFGWTGVWLFFVISGYVISRNFLAREYVDRDWGHEYRNFMLRRFFRIVPVYALYIAIGTIILLLVGQAGALRDLPFLLTFTYNWQMIFNLWPNPQSWSAFGHLWTLSIEEQFYVVYPLLFLLLRPRWYVAALVVLIAAGPFVRFAYSAALTGLSSDAGWLAFAVYAASFAHFDAFLLGALIAWFEGYIRQNERVAVVVAGLALVAVALYAFITWNMNRSAGAAGIEAFRNIFSGILFGGGREVFVYSVVNLVAADLLILAILRKPIMRPLGWPAVALVGRISYGGYLYHALVLWLIFALLPISVGGLSIPQRVVLFVCGWSLTVAVAYVSYRWFEAPIMSWSRRAVAPRAPRQPLENALWKSR